MPFIWRRLPRGTSAAGAATSAPCALAHSGLLAVAECVEAVGKRHHEVACQRVILGVVDILGGDVAHNALLLLQQVIDAQGNRGGFALEELVTNLSVPHPLVGVIAGRITGGRRITEVGADAEAERRGVGAVETAAVGVNTLVVQLGQRVVGNLQVIVGAKFKLKVFGAPCNRETLSDARVD